MFRERSIIIISLSTLWVDYSIKAISREMVVIPGYCWVKKKGGDKKICASEGLICPRPQARLYSAFLTPPRPWAKHYNSYF
jgi:hypothetical protein